MQLRYRADVRSLAVVGGYFALFAASWIAWPQLPPLLRLAAVVLLAMTSWICAVITHNTLHSPMWRSRALNRVTQIALSLSYGFPVSEFLPGHNLSHHRFTQTSRDVMRTSKARSSLQLVNLLTFFFRVGPGVTAGNLRYAKATREKSPRWYRQFLVETALVWGVKVAFLMLDWRRALPLLFVPHLWAVWGITTVNLFQHDGCDPDHPVNHSRNFVGRAFNFITFNNGYHGIHHNEPGLHWSLLPAAHAERVRPLLDPRLDEPSFAGYLFRTYFVPARRLRYDGTPHALAAATPDEDWIRNTVAQDPVEA